jgi:uncharacterized protein with HEPN domain
MSRNPRARLEDIIEACGQIARYIEGYDFQRFVQDAKTRDAVIRQFEIAGEAVKGVPESFRDLEPQIPWRLIAGFRDVLSHSYFAVEMNIVWDVAAVKAPDLKAACERLLAASPPEDSPP